MSICTTHGVPGLNSAEFHAAFEKIAGFGGRAFVHCEDESLTDAAEQRLREAGRVTLAC